MSQVYTYPEAEIVIPPSTAVLLHCSGSRGVTQVMVPTHKHQWDCRIGPPQGHLQVSLLSLSEWRV